jgi:hypothetical protein
LPALLKAFPTENRPSLSWFEGDGCFLAALGTDGACFDLGEASARVRGRSAEDSHSFRFARLTAFGLVLELLVVKKQLLARSEDEIGAAIDAFQNLVLKFHCERRSLQPIAVSRPRLMADRDGV